ncbi:universal stress protein [Parabacteroides sp. FAFU027]|uniref:universal stress protein n=1 Tax=Parabacteroides sp. FAFU027 TaxID=2922715 RepID=UPI001FAEF9FA|nr:universal stress protein [Parabacteroides sp. FAFU027]
MEDKLITLAIHTYEKALILKSLLENEGIEVYIHNVGLIEPMVAAGVRVRIKESDLPRALRIVEMAKLTDESETWPVSDPDQFAINRILAPIDFSPYSVKAAEIAVKLAGRFNAEVMFIHSYYVPIASGVLPIEVTFTGELFSGETLMAVQEKVNKDMAHFLDDLKQKIARQELPRVKYDHVIQEGIPEEEIIRFSKEYKPAIIVMGTRGKTPKTIDYLGSVTAEVIDRSKIPVFAIPQKTELLDMDAIKNVAFIANFNQKDLISFDKLMRLKGDLQFEVHFLHISDKIDVWDEVSLTGMQDYLQKMYPNLKATYGIINGSDVFNSMEEYIRKFDIDMMAITAHKRNIFASLFYPSMANQVLFHTDTPVLVLK